MSEKENGLSEAERADIAGANEQDHLRTSAYNCIEYIINERIKAARLQTLEDVWKCFCKACEWGKQYPSGKECYHINHERIANNETAYVDASIETCPLIKALKEAIK